MKTKKINLFFKISLLLNIIFICYLIYLTYPNSSTLNGTYVNSETINSENNFQYVMSFDNQKNIYVLYKNGELIETNTFYKTDDKTAYTIKGNDLNKYIILEDNSFYFQISEGEFIKFRWDSTGMTFLGEKPEEHRDSSDNNQINY